MSPAQYEEFFSLAQILFPRARIRLEESDEVFLAYHQKELIGFLHLRSRPRSLYLQGIGVLPAYRRHGIGRRLLAHALSSASRLGSPGGLALKVRAGNAEALRFYRSAGFMLERENLSSWRLRWRPAN